MERAQNTKYIHRWLTLIDFCSILWSLVDLFFFRLSSGMSGSSKYSISSLRCWSAISSSVSFAFSKATKSNVDQKTNSQLTRITRVGNGKSRLHTSFKMESTSWMQLDRMLFLFHRWDAVLRLPRPFVSPFRRRQSQTSIKKRAVNRLTRVCKAKIVSRLPSMETWSSEKWINKKWLLESTSRMQLNRGSVRACACVRKCCAVVQNSFGARKIQVFKNVQTLVWYSERNRFRQHARTHNRAWPNVTCQA